MDERYFSLFICLHLSTQVYFMRYETVVDCARYEKHYTRAPWGWSGCCKIWRTELMRNKTLNPTGFVFFSIVHIAQGIPEATKYSLRLCRLSRMDVRTVHICRWIKLCMFIRLSVQSLYHTIRYHFKNG